MKSDIGNNLIGRSISVDPSESMSDAFKGLVPAVILWAGTGLIMKEMLALGGMAVWGFASIGIILSLVFMGLMTTKIRQWVVPGSLVMLTVYFLALRIQVTGGILSIVNHVLDKLTLNDGNVRLDYADASGAGYALVLILVIVAIFYGAACLKGKLIYVAVPSVLIAVGTLMGVFSSASGLIIFALGVALVPLRQNLDNAKSDIMKLITAAVCVALALGLGAMIKNSAIDDIWRDTQLKIHELRYDSISNAMPEGRIGDLGPLRRTDAEALRVTMSEPEKMYLRGHIYEVYTGNSWEKLPAGERAESEDLFYWLHNKGFYGQSQVAQAMDLADEGEKMSVKVENLGACREVSYLPYAFFGGSDKGDLDPYLIGDASWGGDISEFDVYRGSVPEWYETQYVLAADQADEEVGEYISLEQSYGDYVNKHDLQLTQDSWNVIRRQLGEAEGSKSLFEIQHIIRNYLEKNLHYDENAYTMNGEGDFLNYVLERSDGRGYSVQYATAAVLMFRYFGVPARYVEGYYISPDEAASTESGQPITVTEKDAHAWAEFYLNGVGFVPFEVTPGYIDPEDLDLGMSYGNGRGNDGMYQYQSGKMTYAVTEEPEKEQPEVGQRDRIRFHAEILLIMIPLALILLIAFVISRRIRLRKALRRIDEAPNREACAMRYGYAMAIQDLAEGVDLPEGEEAAHINELALFSQAEITDEYRTAMDTYTSRVLDAAQKHWSPMKKLKLKFIDGIY